MTQPWTAILREVERSAREVRVDPRERRDLVQEALLRVWERIEAEGGRRPTSGLVRTVLRRLAIDGWRQVRSREPGVEARGLEARGREPEPDDAAATRELVVLLRRRVAALPAVQREVVCMRVEEGLPFREIARRQDVPLGTALGRMHLAMKKLRSELEALA